MESLKAPGCRGKKEKGNKKKDLRVGWAMAHPAHPADTALPIYYVSIYITTINLRYSYGDPLAREKKRRVWAAE